MIGGMAFGQTSPISKEIHYNVNYHWGIIDVMIAHGIVKTETDGQHFHGTLDGTSIPWEGRVIVVSDTLDAEMLPGEGLGSEKVNYQVGWYRRPKASAFHSSSYDPANPLYYKNTRGEGEYSASHDTMEAIAITSDMIGMYYYGNLFDFENMQPGDKVVIPISGGLSNEVQVTYQGKGSYTQEDVTYPTYNVMFEYGYQGNLSGYQVQMKYSIKDRTPLFLSASLPVGRVEMLYVPD